MSKNSQEDSQAVPFFARFLEGQDVEEISEEESEALSGGTTFQTRKYPSDNEDGGGGVQTLKYPSDNEDGGGRVQTLKYPSDQEDVPCVTNKPRFDKDDLLVTQKFPSDGDDDVVA